MAAIINGYPGQKLARTLPLCGSHASPPLTDVRLQSMELAHGPLMELDRPRKAHGCEFEFWRRQVSVLSAITHSSGGITRFCSCPVRKCFRRRQNAGRIPLRRGRPKAFRGAAGCAGNPSARFQLVQAPCLPCVPTADQLQWFPGCQNRPVSYQGPASQELPRQASPGVMSAASGKSQAQSCTRPQAVHPMRG